jgi:hypothetical protein
MLIRRFGLLLTLMVFAGPAPLAEFPGKVVGVADGDTITILRDPAHFVTRVAGPMESITDCADQLNTYGLSARVGKPHGH